jgi:hypothetical protein
MAVSLSALRADRQPFPRVRLLEDTELTIEFIVRLEEIDPLKKIQLSHRGQEHRTFCL